MKNNINTILLIILLSVLALGITAFMILFMNGNLSNIYSSEKKLILEESYQVDEIEKINIEISSTDVTVKKANDNQIKVEIYGKDSDIATSKVENNSLNITKKSKNFCFGFCFYNDEIVIYLPDDIENTLKITSASGDIEMESFERLNTIIKTASGDVNTDRINEVEIETASGDVSINTLSKASITTASGDIHLGKVLNNVNLKTQSGDVHIKAFEINENSNIKTSSGDVTISSITDVYVEVQTVSGDEKIKRNNRYAENTLSITTASGDVTVK